LKNSVLLGLALFGFGIGTAQARQDPTPPPSGTVIHLFGPDSVTSSMFPEPSGNTPAPAAASSGGSSVAPATSSNYVEPSAGDILHQMFVTGDPNRKPGDALAKGRTSELPGASSSPAP
jgi:hypothetical protein